MKTIIEVLARKTAREIFVLKISNDLEMSPRNLALEIDIVHPDRARELRSGGIIPASLTAEFEDNNPVELADKLEAYLKKINKLSTAKQIASAVYNDFKSEKKERR